MPRAAGLGSYIRSVLRQGSAWKEAAEGRRTCVVVVVVRDFPVIRPL